MAKNNRMIELFCGIGGFRVAADKIGLETVWANDINSESCAVYKSCFGSDVIIEGDIKNLIEAVPKHDILTAGFPCQPFSAAGKKEGVRDPRGTLFQSIVDVLEKNTPKYFVLENVKRLLSMESGAHLSTVLTALSKLNYFIEWRLLNAKNFGLAQNRERIFIVGTRIDSQFDIENNVRDKLKLANSADISSASRGMGAILDKYHLWKYLEQHGNKFPNWGVVLNGKFFSCDLEYFSGAMQEVLLAEILEKSPSSDFDMTKQTIGRLANNEPINRYINGVEIISNQGGGARMGYTIFGVGGLAPTLTASTSRHYERYKIGERYRRLTPREYARLQGFSDDHCRAVSNYSQYGLYGNAVPPPMVEWVLKRLTQEKSKASGTIFSNQIGLFCE